MKEPRQPPDGDADTTAFEPIRTPATLEDPKESGSRAHEIAARSEMPRRLGDLEVGRELGFGGMGRVLEASDPALQRTVAVKVMHAHLVPDTVMHARFLREARVMAQLEHPNIVPVYEMRTAPDGAVHIVMRKVHGKTLHDIVNELREAPPEQEPSWTRVRLLHVFLKACEAVAYAHSRGILHRDLKPDNVMVGEFGEVLVLDWGIAAPMDREGTPSEGVLVGSPGFMSPEQARGKPGIDERSDVWSLGAILYELLTHEPAYKQSSPMQRLARTVSGKPTLPPERAPHLDIPEELSEICMTALDPDPDRRYASPSELAAAIESFLEGSRRRQQANAHVTAARDIWERFHSMGRERAKLLDRDKQLADAADAWAPLSERRALLDVRDALAALEPRRAKLFGEFISECEKALAHDPDHLPARALLADAYWERLQDAERQREEADVAYYSDRVAAFDDGRYSPLLAGTGALSLRTDPPGAEVLCARFERRGLVYPLGEMRSLGETPLSQVPLEMGSYLLTLRYPGKRDTLYPVSIGRGDHWDSGPAPIPLHDDDTIGPDFAYVPGGPYVCGGDRDAPGSKEVCEPWVDAFFIARLPVTMGQYLEFLDALHERDPAEAWRRCPRSETGLRNTEGQYLRRPGRRERYELPDRDADGNVWDARWPAFGISWHDAVAYTQWLSEREGIEHRLAYEHEIEKAARGVDGRFYPWGDGFDRTLCKMGDSRRERPSPEPVGSFPSDVSVYGVHDLAGSMRDWCGDPDFDGDNTLRPVRGGSWNYDPRFCRAACRLGRPPWRVFAYNGFRLVRAP